MTEKNIIGHTLSKEKAPVSKWTSLDGSKVTCKLESNIKYMKCLWWSSGEEFALFAGGHMGSIPHWGTEIPHGVEQPVHALRSNPSPRALDPVYAYT